MKIFNSMIEYFNNNLRIRTKILITLIPSIVIGLFVAGLLINSKTVNTLEENYNDVGENIAHRYANMTQSLLEKQLSTARTLAIFFEQSELIDVSSRRVFFNNILKKLLEENNDFAASWTVWEPNQFDGRDKDFENIDGLDPDGRYNSGYNRGSGKIEFDYSTDLYKEGESDYYLIPLRKNKATLIEPYYYAYSSNPNNNLFMTSIAIPINKKGNTVGVVGFDLTMNYIQLEFDKIKPYKDGFLMLISNTGVIACHEDKTLLSKNLKEVYGDEFYKEFKNSLNNNISSKLKINSIEKNKKESKMDFYFQPFKVGNIEESWSVVVAIPKEIIIHKTSEILTQLILSGLILLLFIVSIMIFISNLISKRLSNALNIALETAKGNLNSFK